MFLVVYVIGLFCNLALIFGQIEVLLRRSAPFRIGTEVYSPKIIPIFAILFETSRFNILAVENILISIQVQLISIIICKVIHLSIIAVAK